MQMNAIHHDYSNQTESYFKNNRFSKPDGLGMVDKVSPEFITGTTEDLRNYLANFDLRNISPNDLAKLASKLFEEGEISDSAAGEFIMAARLDRLDQTTPIDAIKLFEEKFEHTVEVSKNDPTLESAKRIASDSLHTIYNISDFISGIRANIGVDIKV